MEAFRNPRRTQWAWLSGTLIGKRNEAEYLLWMTTPELLRLFCCLLVSSIIMGPRRPDLPPLVREEEETLADSSSSLPNGSAFLFFSFFCTTRAESHKRLQIVC